MIVSYHSGHKPVFLAGFALLPLRGVVYTPTQNPYALVSIKVLDDVGAKFSERSSVSLSAI